jgi:phosphatidylinositol-3,4,5-trisphosphate 3-phosphatase/dual-specificity protein phosphatase PTEN
MIVGSGGSGQGRAWASVARYEDEYVEELKRRGGMGGGIGGDITWGGIGGDGTFDTQKMFRSFGKLSSGDLPENANMSPDHQAGITSDITNPQEYIVHHLISKDSSIILDRGREVRLKLHLASMPLGWAWMIPAFHLPEPVASSTDSQPIRTHTLDFRRSQIDFPLGPGQSIHRVLVRLEEVPESEHAEPSRLMSDEEERRSGVEDHKGEDVKEEGE